MNRGSDPRTFWTTDQYNRIDKESFANCSSCDYLNIKLLLGQNMQGEHCALFVKSSTKQSHCAVAHMASTDLACSFLY
jgi:hypothetical protein